LPLGVFRHGDEEPRVGAAIGDQVIDLAPVASAQMLDGSQLFAEPTLNAFLALGRPAWRATRNWLLELIRNPNDRAGTIVASGTEIIRPSGQRRAPDAAVPTYGPSQRLDIEVELGYVVG